MKKRKITHGGKRDGAGRPGEDRIAKGIRLRRETIKKIESTGKALTEVIVSALKSAGYDNP